MDSWHLRPNVWMCILLACSSVSLVITALKLNSLPYEKFSKMFSNLVIYVTSVEFQPFFLRYLIVFLEWVLYALWRNNWRKRKGQTSRAQWWFYFIFFRCQMFCSVTRISGWNLNWSVTGVFATVPLWWKSQN